MTKTTTTDNCAHKFQYLATARWRAYQSAYQIKWIRVDRFFCQLCLKEVETRREDWSREMPDWYRT